MKKLLVKIVVLKQQETILYDTNRDAQLVHCIVRSVPIFQPYPRMI